MGLLDSLLYGQNADFGGQNAGLLDFLRTSQMQNDQYQPSAGFPAPDPAQAPASFADRFGAMPGAPAAFVPSGRSFDKAIFNPATYAPNQAQPIAVGNSYQMPRIGSADLYNAPPPAANAAAIPPNATPTQGTLPPQGTATDFSAQSRQPQPDQSQGLPPAFGGGGYLNRLENGGSLIGSLFGDSGKQQNLSAQYHAIRQALETNGDTPQAAASKAMVAVMNPEAAKTILPELFTTKEKAQKLTDSFGNERIVFSNEREGTTHEANSTSGGSSTPATVSGDFGHIADNIAKAKAAGATRDQLLQQIPPMYRGYVDSVLQDKALPTNMGRGKARMAILGLAHEVDPNFNEELIPTRLQMRKDFAGEGKNGQAIGALNTVQHHAGQVSDAIDQFEKAGGGGNYPLLNAGKLMIANNTNANPQLRDAAQKLQDKLNATEHEVASAYNSGHITDSDRKTWNEIKASNLPANQLKQKLADFVDLLDGKRDSLNHMYQQTFHEDAPTIDKQTNAATSAKIHSRLPDYAKTSEGGAASASSGYKEGDTATNRQTGAKITFRDGKWQ
jgi:hypothetical protein